MEEEERKRNEEKMRRDAIFEKYMRRKKAVDGIPESEMTPSSSAMPSKATPQSAAPVVFRKKSATSRQGSARPLSQPPPSSGNLMSVVAEKGVAIGQHLGSHGSDDNLLDAEAVSCLTRGKYYFVMLRCILLVNLSTNY